MYHIKIESTMVNNANIKRDIVADDVGQVLNTTAELCCQAFHWLGCAFIRKEENTFSVHELVESDIDLYITQD